MVFADEAGVVSARRWCWRQSGQSATGPDTTEVLVTVEGHHDTAAQDVAAATRDILALLTQHQPSAQIKSGALFSVPNGWTAHPQP